MINYICDICGKKIGDNRRYVKERPKYEIHVRRYSKSRHDKKPYAYNICTDLCDECQAKVDVALDTIFKDIVDKVDVEFENDNFVSAVPCSGENVIDDSEENEFIDYCDI